MAKYMTYEDLVVFINTEKTGIAKSYDFEYLRKKFFLEDVEKQIASDLVLFADIEKSLVNSKEPKEGDFVQFDGNISRLSRIHNDGTIQLSETIGVYVSDSCTQASGCVFDSKINLEISRLNIRNLELVPELKKGTCWTFSGNQAGVGRGVYFEINFKIWNLTQAQGE